MSIFSVVISQKFSIWVAIPLKHIKIKKIRSVCVTKRSLSIIITMHRTATNLMDELLIRLPFATELVTEQDR